MWRSFWLGYKTIVYEFYTTLLYLSHKLTGRARRDYSEAYKRIMATLEIQVEELVDMRSIRHGLCKSGLNGGSKKVIIKGKTNT